MHSWALGKDRVKGKRPLDPTVTNLGFPLCFLLLQFRGPELLNVLLTEDFSNAFTKCFYFYEFVKQNQKNPHPPTNQPINQTNPILGD